MSKKHNSCNYGINIEKKVRGEKDWETVQNECIERFVKMIKNNKKRIMVSTEYVKPSDERRRKEKYIEKSLQRQKDLREGITRRKRGKKRPINRPLPNTNTLDKEQEI